MTSKRKRILYFEDDPETLRDYYNMLRAEYEVTIGAYRGLTEQPRQRPFDLLILDLMIHPQSLDEEEKIRDSVSFQGVNWRLTGVEFLRRLRAGEYVEFGLPADIPIVVATAVVDYTVREEIIRELGVDADVYLEKPFTMDALEEAIHGALMGSEDKG